MVVCLHLEKCGGISLVIEKGDRVGKLYLCPLNTYYSISVASTETGAVLWHHRLGHMSEKGM